MNDSPENIIRVPKPAKSSFDPQRPLARNQLLQTQVHNMHKMEQHLPPEQRTGIPLESITTEGEASEYIRRVTSLFHPHTAKKKPAAKKTKAARKPKVKRAT